MPTCGAVIQPIAVSVVSTASPLAAAAQGAMPPVTTSGRARPGSAGPWPSPAPPEPGRPRGTTPESGASGASAETLTNPILATIASQPEGGAPVGISACA